MTENDAFTTVKEAFIINRTGVNISTVLFPNGNVGIGTTAPGSYKLAVAGKIGAWGEVKVFNTSSTFPDYVFDKTYYLRPLAEVAQYIQANHHLPEIPTAKTVETEGMGLVEMQTLMVKKVEELTLYLIDQNKQLQELKRENTELREKVSKLEK